MKKLKVLSKDGKSYGYATGGEYHCRMESCKGNRIGIRWTDGKMTFPCSQGLKWLGDTLAQII